MIFKEEVLRFETLSTWLGERPLATCSFCARALYAGEGAWFCGGETACCDCFEIFARAQLAPFYTILGEEGYE